LLFEDFKGCCQGGPSRSTVRGPQDYVNGTVSYRQSHSFSFWPVGVPS
jgi:hypothetical protein